MPLAPSRSAGLSLAVVAAVLVSSIAACSGAERSGEVREGSAGTDAVRIEMQDNSFSPPSVRVPTGGPVTIELTNTGVAVHDFTVESLGTSTGPIAAGETVTVTLPAVDGATPFECTLHGEMNGTLTAG